MSPKKNKRVADALDGADHEQTKPKRRSGKASVAAPTAGIARFMTSRMKHEEEQLGSPAEEAATCAATEQQCDEQADHECKLEEELTAKLEAAGFFDMCQTQADTADDQEDLPHVDPQAAVSNPAEAVKGQKHVTWNFGADNAVKPDVAISDMTSAEVAKPAADAIASATSPASIATAAQPAGGPPITTSSLGTLMAQAKPLCGKCGYEVDPFRAQIKTKGSQNFICNGCNSRCASLSRNLGTWPPEFKLLSPDDQQKFWRDLANGRNVEQLRMTLVDTLVRTRTDRIKAEIGGSYLPLSVYERHRFTTADVEQNCHDFKEHAVLGKVYRVAIESLARSSVEETQRQLVMKLLDRSAGLKDAKGAKVKPVADAAPETSANSGSDSESSAASDDSSSSSHKKKHKKGDNGKKKKNKKGDKKTKNHKKNDEGKSKNGKNDKEKEKDKHKKNKVKDDGQKNAKAAAAKILKFSTQVTAKVAHPIYTLENALKEKLKSKVAGFAVEGVETSLQLMKKMRSEAQNRIDDKKSDVLLPLPWTIEQVTEACKNALSNASVFQNMIEAASNHFQK